MNIPKEIKVKSDGNILQLSNTIKTKDGLRYQYVYSKSKTKKGLTVEFDENTLTKLININS